MASMSAGGYTAALPSPATSSPIATTRATINTAQQNQGATLGGVNSGLLTGACILLLALVALLVVGRLTLKTARLV